MNHEVMSEAMLWVGALFVFTPIILTGIVIGAIRFQRRAQAPRSTDDTSAAGPPAS